MKAFMKKLQRFPDRRIDLEALPSRDGKSQFFRAAYQTDKLAKDPSLSRIMQWSEDAKAAGTPKARKEYIEKVESLKTRKIAEYSEMLKKNSEDFQKRSYTSDVAQLLDLQRAQLKAKTMSEQSALHMISEASRSGVYDQDVMLSLTPISKEVAQSVGKLIEKTPPEYANPASQELIRAMGTLMDAKTGFITYQLTGEENYRSLNYLDLMKFESPEAPLSAEELQVQKLASLDRVKKQTETSKVNELEAKVKRLESLLEGQGKEKAPKPKGKTAVKAL